MCTASKFVSWGDLVDEEEDHDAAIASLEGLWKDRMAIEKRKRGYIPESVANTSFTQWLDIQHELENLAHGTVKWSKEKKTWLIKGEDGSKEVGEEDELLKKLIAQDPEFNKRPCATLDPCPPKPQTLDKNEVADSIPLMISSAELDKFMEWSVREHLENRKLKGALLRVHEKKAAIEQLIILRFGEELSNAVANSADHKAFVEMMSPDLLAKYKEKEEVEAVKKAYQQKLKQLCQEDPHVETLAAARVEELLEERFDEKLRVEYSSLKESIKFPLYDYIADDAGHWCEKYYKETEEMFGKKARQDKRNLVRERDFIYNHLKAMADPLFDKGESVQLPRGENDPVYANHNHPYWKGICLGVWLFQKKPYRDTASPWYGADKVDGDSPLRVPRRENEVSTSYWDGIMEGMYTARDDFPEGTPRFLPGFFPWPTESE
ncbi:hypothetical protein BS50DRAFT_588272 [Corynespora cassiicola Philippines]|uniref:Uncharacterized protein n=1 Tax=Corynespora cassiicola Philippines TaxID=1448308 RepID=A0A2T2NQD2_CORCC|nr:hypothetical protein BS50DRAFT_588272 [Corynespora cassiicola Philippines]